MRRGDCACRPSAGFFDRSMLEERCGVARRNWACCCILFVMQVAAIQFVASQRSSETPQTKTFKIIQSSSNAFSSCMK
jgi:hypothetical protein